MHYLLGNSGAHMAHGNSRKAQMNEFEKGLAIGMHKAGKSYRAISEEFGRSPETIRQICIRFDEKGEWERKEGTGKKNKKTTAKQDKDIKRLVKQDRFISSPVIKQKLNLDVCDRTIRRRIGYFGFANYWAVKKPFISEGNRKKRVAWAKKHIKWPLKKWKTVLFSDESPYVLRVRNRRRVWRLPNERYAPWCIQGTVKNDKKIMVWGCFSWNGMGDLCRVKGIMKKEQYHSILVHHMKPSGKQLFGNEKFIFQQDNDPKHTAIIIRKYFEKQTDFTKMDWASQSPDLAPIENLWAYVDQRAFDRKPQNEAELFSIIKEEWEKIPLKVIQNLIKSMPKRCQAVIDNEGWPTKY